MSLFHNFISFLIILFTFITFICSSHAHTFQVGGKDGWTLHPSENYNNWSSRLRFLINDTLHFIYHDGSDSVLVVNKSDYHGCNVNNPINKMHGGDSTFKFDRSGPFYFISGNKSNCDHGQKLTVVVLALRKRSSPPSVAIPPSIPPSSSTMPPSPSISPVSPPLTAISPVSPPSMSPISPPSIGGSPMGSPIGSPESLPSGTPVFSRPAPSPEGGSADSPSGGSTISPGGGGTDSPGGETAPPPGGTGGLSPGGSGSGANATTPSLGVTTQALSGTIFISLVTTMFGLYGFNYLFELES